MPRARSSSSSASSSSSPASSSGTPLVHRQQQFRRDRRFTVCKASTRVIYAALERRVDDWQSYINLARSVMSSVDEMDFMAQSHRTSDQVWIINGIQKLAYYRPDEVELRDLADWAIRQWLTISAREPDNVDALQGMGTNWLFRAQPSIAAIEKKERSTPSSKDADEAGSNPESPASSSVVSGEDDEEDDDDEEEEDEQTAKRSAILLQARLCSHHYVEARGLLLPATEFYEKAVDVASSNDAAREEDDDDTDGSTQLSGGLLALAAEAFMSLGNVSFDEPARKYFSQALEYLRLAKEIEGYVLPAHLKEWLDDYGRLANPSTSE